MPPETKLREWEIGFPFIDEHSIDFKFVSRLSFKHQIEP